MVIDLPKPKLATHKIVEAENIRPCEIAIVGEAPGEEETDKGRPFLGRSGWLLNKILKQIGIERDACLITNVFRDRPLNNDVNQFFVKKSVAKRAGYSSEYPAGVGGLVHPDFAGELARLAHELERARPRVVIALGVTALWALTGRTSIASVRGTVLESSLVPGLLVVPTYHPAAILRQWENLTSVVADFRKAKRTAIHGNVVQSRSIWLYPELADLGRFSEQFIYAVPSGNSIPDPSRDPVGKVLYGDDKPPLGVDIETRWDVDHQITCIGFAPNPDVALVVPFWDVSKPGFNYWSASDEVQAWKWCAQILGDPTIPKLFQNGSYDVQVLAHWGIKVEGRYEDTMILHHALEPELPKALDYLGSIYTNESAWKDSVNFKTDKVDA